MKKLIVFTVITLFPLLSLFAQTGDFGNTGESGLGLKKTGQTSMNFLQVGVSPKEAGLGGAITSLSHGVESIFSNPAGLSEMNTDFGVFLSTTQWFADIKYHAAAAAWNASDYGVIGLSFIIVDYGTIRGTRLLPYADAGKDALGYEPTGDINNVGAFAFGLTYGRQINDRFSIGGTVKYVGQQLGQLIYSDGTASDNNAKKLAFDFGVKYFTGIKSLRLGMSMRNFGTFIKYQNFSSSMPLMFSVGLGMNVLDLFEESQDHKVFISSEFVHPTNYTDRVLAGIEYEFMNMVSLRGGYESNHDVLGFAAGIGLKQTVAGTRIEFDYSYSKAEFFDNVNRFSLNVAF
jgi:hypothetical protein